MTEYHYEIGTARWKKFTSVGDFRRYNPPAGWEVTSLKKLNAHPLTGATLDKGWWVKETYHGFNDEIEQQIAEARCAKKRHGYKTTAVICRTEYEVGKFSIGFHFSDNEPVGYKGTHSDGLPFEVVATV